MFNDPLSVEQCRDLLARLTECAFPFQCAHGRPSMVPLVDLGGRLDIGGSMDAGDVGAGADFVGALKKWKDARVRS